MADTEERTTGRAGEWPRGLPEHVTAPLLDRIIEQSMDDDYRQVAARRGGGSPLPAGRPRFVAAAVIAAFGILVTVAAVQTSAREEITDASRATLSSRANAEREQVQGLQDRVTTLQDDTIALERRPEDLAADLQQAFAEQRRLETRTGYVAVRGEGVLVTVDDFPEAEVTEMIRDEDLAMLVDGLWSAGAEAISINDQRITALSGIHNRGIAIEVGGRAVNPPYEIRAIGDVDVLAADLLDTTHGAKFFAFADALGWPLSVENVQGDADLRIPSATGPVLTWVRPGVAGKPGMDEKKEANP